MVRHLPAALLASFVKKLSRLSLAAPPAAIVTVVPFVYNILKRHPALMVMIHCADIDEACIGIYYSPKQVNNQLNKTTRSFLSQRRRSNENEGT
jgi:U3 small nucleolar RNA-associated protein 19